MTTTTRDRMRCPTCGRDVAARVVRGPRVNNGRPVPALRLPVRHNRPGYVLDNQGTPQHERCPAGEGRR